MTTKQVPLSAAGPACVGIYFLPRYPVGGCPGDPAKLDTISAVVRPSRETSTENFFGKGELRLRPKYHAVTSFRLSRTFWPLQPTNERLWSSANINCACQNPCNSWKDAK